MKAVKKVKVNTKTNTNVKKAKELPIQWMLKKSRINQIYNEGLEYAFVSNDLKQINQMVFCKDFMQDALLGFLNKRKVSIYSFTYDPSVDIPLCIKTTRLMVSNSKDKQFRQKIPACLDFLNQIETHLKMRKTTVKQCAAPPSPYTKAGIWLFEGSKRWLQAPPMISLYTLLIRIGFSHTQGQSFEKTMNDIISEVIKPYQSNDKTFLKNAKKAIDWILNFGDRRLFHRNIKENYPEHMGVYDMHNSCGIVGYSQESMKSQIPYWYRLQSKKGKKGKK